MTRRPPDLSLTMVSNQAEEVARIVRATSAAYLLTDPRSKAPRPPSSYRSDDPRTLWLWYDDGFFNSGGSNFRDWPVPMIELYLRLFAELFDGLSLFGLWPDHTSLCGKPVRHARLKLLSRLARDLRPHDAQKIVDSVYLHWDDGAQDKQLVHEALVNLGEIAAASCASILPPEGSNGQALLSYWMTVVGHRDSVTHGDVGRWYEDILRHRRPDNNDFLQRYARKLGPPGSPSGWLLRPQTIQAWIDAGHPTKDPP